MGPDPFYWFSALLFVQSRNFAEISATDGRYLNATLSFTHKIKYRETRD